MFKPKMGIQLYTLRDYIKNKEDFDTTLARLQKMGVKDVQISGIGDFPAADQAEVLKKYDMQVCITHKSFDDILEDTDKMIEDHKIIGCDAMGIGSAPDEGRYSAKNVRDFIAKANALGERLSKEGMTFNYHNHHFEFQRLSDMSCCMMDLLLEETDPEYFHFIPDVAWIDYAEQDSVKVLEKMKGRVKVLHFKDYMFLPNRERRFTSLGKGTVDLEACYEAACRLEIPYIMYEQDIDWLNGDPFQSTEESWEYMMKLDSRN